MTKPALLSAVFFALMPISAISAPAQKVAARPPMGWNSWDSYGFTIDEAQFKANAAVLASIKQYGWEYAVIDEGWYMANPEGRNLDERHYLWNASGLLVPDSARYPSAAGGAGFKPLADWLHAQGLKFGIHIVRGIPRGVVAANLPIAGTAFHATDAADTASPCPWDEGNWGIKDNAAGQAYYDSMIALYAQWGLDFLKVDCISDHPYRPTEIRQIAEAIRKSGRPIVLSLSPGPTALEHATEVAQYAQMWRITNDHWDAWQFNQHTPDGYPFGLMGEFDVLAKWASYAGPGHWPDADMLPEGWIGPHPGMGPERQSRLTADEQRTEFTLWAIARSPLILGGNLTKLDDLTRSLITSRDLLSINQYATYSRPVETESLGAGFANVRIWKAEDGVDCAARYLAFFNLADAPVTVHFPWDQFVNLTCKLSPSIIRAKKVVNLWDGKKWDTEKPMDLTLPPHGSTIFLLEWPRG